MSGALREDAAIPAQRVIERLVADVEGLTAVQISTADGYVVAAHLSTGVHDKKLAAMSSSLIGLAESVSQELKIGAPENLLVEAKHGTAVALRVSEHLLLLAAVSRGASLGTVLWQAKSAAEAIRIKVESRA